MAVSASALFEFEEAAGKDKRFQKSSVADWSYSCEGEEVEDVQVNIEFRDGLSRQSVISARGEKAVI